MSRATFSYVTSSQCARRYGQAISDKAPKREGCSTFGGARSKTAIKDMDMSNLLVL